MPYFNKQSESGLDLDVESFGNDSEYRLGQVLVDHGKIGERDIERILEYARKKQLRFGEAASRLRLISHADLERAMAAQFDYPYLEKGAGGYSSELVTAFKPFSRKGRALRILRAQLLSHWYSEESKTLAIIGSGQREGCSYIAANLAVVFSQLGHRTLLVDANLQHARQHKIFAIKNGVGLSGVLIGRASFESVIEQMVLFRDLSILPAGTSPPNPAELLGRSELTEIMPWLRHQYEVVIFDTPPVLESLGAEAVAAACGNALVVLRKDHTQLSNAVLLTQVIRDSGADVVGAVMTDF